MAKTNLRSMSVEQLLQLRDDVAKELSRKATELQSQLARLGGEVVAARRMMGGRGSALKGRRVPIKYRDRAGNTWAGRGVKPKWMVEQLKQGKKLEDFAVEKTTPGRKRRKK
jgi:DNA-binding protein H-NS